MRITDLQQHQLDSALRDQGVWLQAPPFLFHLRSTEPALAEGVARLYGDYPVALEGDWADFHISVRAGNGWRRWVRPQVNFFLDRLRPFKPLPGNQAFPLLEWGLNWCVANHMHRYLILHCAVVARGDEALLLPGASGNGKSTLCAALVARGWRLLSDELALVDPRTRRVQPFVRPISLKNRSIDVIREFAPQMVMSEVVNDTQKGSVAHVKAPLDAVLRGGESAAVRWILFPRYARESETVITRVRRGTAMMYLQQQAFNYQLHGVAGFDTLTELVRQSTCHQLTYSSLEEVAALLVEGVPAGIDTLEATLG
ncbi:HprK-related kinase A [Aestuariirhabdus sp. LZHN29]|uniref:HprK-related kinase A n=1 Tax=Aestuariirhabdus sp. LZHN29 TaxID=3417462 RepID=UPI003CE962CF